MANDIIRHVNDDGIEFFTVRATGESGMSKAGLAFFCGVSKQAISKLFKKIESGDFAALEAVNQNSKKQSSSILNSLIDKPLKLSTGVVSGTQYTNVDIVPDQVCTVIMTHYAYEAQSPTERAKQSLILFSSIGLRAYIHAVTGWLDDLRNPRAYFAGLIIDEPRRWDEHFSSEWRIEAERVTGWKWNDRVMGKFLNEAVYSYFPQEMRDRLDEVNPMDQNGRRPRKQHQHFEEKTDEILREHIKTVHILMQASSTIYEFRRLMESKFQGRYQLSLRF